MRVLPRAGIDADIDGSVEPIFDSLANERNLHHWVVATLLRHVEERINCVGGDGLLVRVVRRSLLNLAEEVLLDIKLADMRNRAALNGVVGKELSTMVDDG